MNFRSKLLLALLLVSPTTEAFAASALFGNASCSEIRAAIADAEKQLRQWEDYKANGGPGGAGMNLNDLRSKINAGKAEYASICSGQGNQQNAPPPPPPGTGPGQRGGPQFSRDNPFAPGHQQGGGGQQEGPRFSPDNPFAPGHQQGGTGQQGGAPAQQGGPQFSPGNPFAPGGQQSGTGQQGGTPAAEPPKDPTVNYHGQACYSFTKPGVRPDGGGINAYADGAGVCYGGRYYECEQRRWSLRGPCSVFDPKGTHRAEDIEKSAFDINIYQKE